MENKKPHYLQHRKRLKERFTKAPYAMLDAEIIELLLGYVIKGKDVKPQAKEVLSHAKTISKIFDVELTNIKGLGNETTLFFQVLKEFNNRINYQGIKEKRIACATADEVFKFLKLKIGSSKKEVFMILFLDTKNKLINYKIVREGFVNSVAMSPRDIIEQAILHNAVSVIIAHNHPSGDSNPSESDFKITKQICHALQYTGINLLDHLIITFDDYYSMNSYGHIQQFYNEVKMKI